MERNAAGVRGESARRMKSERGTETGRGARGRGWILLPLSLGFVWLLLDAGAVRDAAREGLALCGSTVVPSLFPFLVVTSLLVSQGFGTWAAPLFSGLMTPLYRLPGQAGGALALGLLGRYPVGARTAAELYRAGTLTRGEAERLLGFCNNANPAFFLGVLGAGVFHSARVGTWLLLIHILSALLTGLCFRGGRRTGDGDAWRAGNASRNGNVSADGSALRREPPPVVQEPEPFFPAFVGAVGSGAAAMVRVCGFVVFFYVAALPLRELGGPHALWLAGTVELFSLLPLLTPDHVGFIAAAVFSGWGGLSVLGQTAAVLDGSGLSARNCVLGKAVQAALSGALAAGLAASGLVGGL